MHNDANNIKCRVMNMELDQILAMKIQVNNKCSLLIYQVVKWIHALHQKLH